MARETGVLIPLDPIMSVFALVHRRPDYDRNQRWRTLMDGFACRCGQPTSNPGMGLLALYGMAAPIATAGTLSASL